MVGQVLDTNVSCVKIGRIDPGVVFLPGKPGFIRASRIVWLHVWVQACYDLHYIETFAGAISGQCLETTRPGKPLAQSHPPGVTQPEERRAIGMLEMTAVTAYTQGAVAVERVISRVRLDYQLARAVVQVGIGSVATHRAARVLADRRRSIS